MRPVLGLTVEKGRVRRPALSALLLLSTVAIQTVTAAQLNEHCIVSVLNRNVQVNPDGSWVLPNVPANFGPVRARATCVENGITRSGQSALFTLLASGVLNLPDIILGPATPIPTELTVSAGMTTLTQGGQTVQLTVTGKYADGATANLTAASTGTQYLISNANLATITPEGLVTALASGTVLVQAQHEGAQGLLRLMIVLSRDTDGDGILDDIELREGLDPNNPVDALDDLDRDGLNNRDELQRGTNLRNPDTDGDTILDGEEVILGRDGFITNPLLADTDGDGVPDGIEVQTGSHPLDRNSYDLSRALKTFSVAPTNFTLVVNTLFPQASQQLTVTGLLIDGKTTMDLTSMARRTNYASSNLAVCNFGSPDGRVFAGSDGSCTITVTNSGFTAVSNGVVRSFSPTALSFVSIPGFANNVDVKGDYAYLAAGSTGLQVVAVPNRANPLIVASRDTPGNANDVVVAGSYAYVADGPAGLQIINVSNPLAPVIVGSYDTPGDAWDVVVRGTRACVADGPNGLQILDVTNPAAPQRLGFLATPGTAKGVDLDASRQIAVIAAGTSGLHVVNVANPASPSLLATLAGGDVRDVVLSGNYAFLADFSRSFTSVDLTNPAAPVLRGSTPQATGGLLQDVALTASFAAGADVFFVNGVPIIDVSTPGAPTPRAILDFRNFRDDDGTGIAMDGSFVYLTAALGGYVENGASGDSRLYIGQYLAMEDIRGIPPTVRISSPSAGATVIHGSTVPVTVEANDDVAVVAVTLLVNGQPVGTDTTVPYEFPVLAPTSGASMTVSATAVDLGGNTGTAPAIMLSLIPDPLTAVVGAVVDPSSQPVAGATVSVFDQFTSTTAAGGGFTIPGVPTIRGDISVKATATVAGNALTGQSPLVPPVRGGTTDVGTFKIASCLLQPPGLTNFWPGDGNANDVAGGVAGTLQNGATFAPGEVGQAFSLDGVDDYVSVPDAPSLNPTNAITVEAWINRTAAVGSFDPVVKKAGIGLDWSTGYTIEFSGNSITFWVYSQSVGWRRSELGTVQLGTWTHVAGVYDGTGIQLYLNGTAVGGPTPSPGPIAPSPNPLNIGRDPSNPDRLYRGLIDEASIYNRALSASEVQSLFSAGSKGKCRF